jgi:hypothetical protein
MPVHAELKWSCQSNGYACSGQAPLRRSSTSYCWILGSASASNARYGQNAQAVSTSVGTDTRVAYARELCCFQRYVPHASCAPPPRIVIVRSLRRLALPSGTGTELRNRSRSANACLSACYLLFLNGKNAKSARELLFGLRPRCHAVEFATQ